MFVCLLVPIIEFFAKYNEQECVRFEESIESLNFLVGRVSKILNEHRD